MPKQRHFFATPSDLKAALTRAESVVSVQFVNALLSHSDGVNCWESLAAWPPLGICQHGRPTGGGMFLVLAKDVEIGYKNVTTGSGETLKKADVASNPTAFIFEPGGVFVSSEDGETLVVGKIATTNIDSAVAEEQFAKFSTAFLKGFSRASGAHCGPEAARWIADGVPTAR